MRPIHSTRRFSGSRRSGKWLVLFCVSALCSLPGFVAAEDISPQRSWSSEEAGVRVRLLAGWTVESEPDTLPLVLREPTGRAVMGLFVQPLNSDETAPDLAKLTDLSIRAHKKSIEKFKLINRRTVQIDGGPATELFFRGKRSDVSYRWIQTMFLSGGKKVFVLYSAPAGIYERYVGDYDQIVRSVRKLPS